MDLRAARVAAVALVAAFAVGWLTSCSSDADKRQRHEARAEEFLREGKPREALIELRSALKLEPKDAGLHFEIGTVFEGLGNLSEALFFYQEATRLAPQDNAAALASARLLLFEEPERAEALIEASIERAPDDPLGYIRRSDLALTRAKTADALAAAQLAVEKAPESHMAHFQVGVVQRARIRELALLREPEDPALFEQALAAFDRGLAVAASDAPTGELVRGAIERAFVFASWPARRAEAGPAFRSAFELARERESALESGRVLAEAQKYANEAGDAELERWALEEQIELNPRAYGAWARLASLSPGDDAVLKRLIETLPDDGRAQVLYSRILSERGREAEAVAHLRAVEARIEDAVPLRAAQAELLIEQGAFDEARPLVEALMGDEPERAESLDVASLLAMRERRYADALAPLGKLLERRETARARMRLAEAEFRQQNYAPALVAANRALELSSVDDERLQILRLKADIELASKDNEAALLTLRRIRRATGGQVSPADVLLLAQALYATGRDQAAAGVLAEVIAGDRAPLPAILLYLRHERARDPDAAAEVLERAAERYPTHVTLLGYLVRRDFREGKPERAVERVAAAVAAEPKSSRLLRLQALVLSATGKPAEALAAAERALELKPGSSNGADLIVRLLSQLGRQEEAIERLERQAQEGKLGVAGRVVLARLNMREGRDARAVELLESALAERSDLPGGKNDLAFLLARQGGDLERARRLAEEARAALPRSAEVADTMGYVYLKKGLASAATDQFLAALELAEERTPIWATAQYHLGLGYKALGKTAEARLAFERSLATAVEFPEAAEARREVETLAAAAGAS